MENETKPPLNMLKSNLIEKNKKILGGFQLSTTSNVGEDKVLYLLIHY